MILPGELGRGHFITEMLIANQRFEATLNFQPLEPSLLMVGSC